MAIKLEELQEILTQAGIDAGKRTIAMHLAKEMEAAKKAEKEEEKDGEGNGGKYKNVVFIRGDESLKRLVEGGAWIAQELEDAPEGSFSITDGLIAAAARQNEALNAPKSGRGRKSKGSQIVSWFNLFAWLKPKILNEVTRKGMKIKTKQPVEVRVLTTEDVPFAK